MKPSPSPPLPAGFSVDGQGSARGQVTEHESGKFARTRVLSAELCTLLADLGVKYAFGLIGGANAAFVHSLGESSIQVVHCRHEGAAGFAAAEAFFASGDPALVFATTGPGLLNALNGIAG